MLLLRSLFSFLVLGLPLLAAAKATPCEVPYVIIEEVQLQGNETTKEQVLLIELTFSPGDTVATHELEALLEDNRKRLFNLRLFNEVTARYTCTDGFVSVVFGMQERWYLYPFPIFDIADRNFAAWLERRDWTRLDYGFSIAKRNFRGRNEEVRVRVQQGFNKRLEFAYRIPYISRAHNLGLDFSVADYRSRAIDFSTRNNRQRFLVLEDQLPIKRTGISTAIIRRRSVQRQEGFRLGYLQEQIADSVAVLNPEYYQNAVRERQSVRLEVFKVINLRESFSYPVEGSYFEAIIGQSLFLNGSGKPITTLRAKYVDYARLGQKYFYTIGAEGQLRLSQQYTYADNQALGFRSHVRGYELNVVGGQRYGLFKQGLSREMLNIPAIHIRQIRNNKFNNIPLAVYLNAFTDVGYVQDKVFQKQNPLANRLLYGGGLGLHVVTFYDMVFRVEYTLNREGNTGFYLSTRFPF